MRNLEHALGEGPLLGESRQNLHQMGGFADEALKTQTLASVEGRLVSFGTSHFRFKYLGEIEAMSPAAQ